MKQLTIRGIDDSLEQSLRALAQRQGTSLNRAALQLLRRGAGLDESQEAPTVGRSLDAFIGTWSSEQAEEMETALAVFEQIDEALWTE